MFPSAVTRADHLHTEAKGPCEVRAVACLSFRCFGSVAESLFGVGDQFCPWHMKPAWHLFCLLGQEVERIDGNVLPSLPQSKQSYQLAVREQRLSSRVSPFLKCFHMPLGPTPESAAAELISSISRVDFVPSLPTQRNQVYKLESCNAVALHIICKR